MLKIGAFGETMDKKESIEWRQVEYFDSEEGASEAYESARKQFD